MRCHQADVQTRGISSIHILRMQFPAFSDTPVSSKPREVRSDNAQLRSNCSRCVACCACILAIPVWPATSTDVRSKLWEVWAGSWSGNDHLGMEVMEVTALRATSETMHGVVCLAKCCSGTHDVMRSSTNRQHPAASTSRKFSEFTMPETVQR